MSEQLFIFTLCFERSTAYQMKQSCSGVLSLEFITETSVYVTVLRGSSKPPGDTDIAEVPDHSNHFRKNLR